MHGDIIIDLDLGLFIPTLILHKMLTIYYKSEVMGKFFKCGL